MVWFSWLDSICYLKLFYLSIIQKGHLHTGNVLIEQNGNNVRLTDLPNGLLGLSFFYRTFVIDQRKIQVKYFSFFSL